MPNVEEARNKAGKPRFSIGKTDADIMEETELTAENDNNYPTQTP